MVAFMSQLTSSAPQYHEFSHRLTMHKQVINILPDTDNFFQILNCISMEINDDLTVLLTLSIYFVHTLAHLD